MYIESVPSRNSRPATLLRQGWREGKRVRKKTPANLTDRPAEKVKALLAMTRRLGLERPIAPKRCPERDRVLTMVPERLLHPASKLATTRPWHSTKLAEELGVGNDDENALHRAKS